MYENVENDFTDIGCWGLMFQLKNEKIVFVFDCFFRRILLYWIVWVFLFRVWFDCIERNIPIMIPIKGKYFEI